MRLRRVWLAGFLLFALPCAAPAGADGPDHWAVSGVAANKMLNIRAAPKPSARVVGRIPPDTRRLQNLGCKGVPSFRDWLKLHGAARREAGKNRWCHIRHQGIEGWVRGKFLVEDPD